MYFLVISILYLAVFIVFNAFFGNKKFALLVNLCFAVCAGICLFSCIDDAITKSNAATLQEAREIAANPKGWIVNQISDVSDVSLGGVMLLVERKIKSLKSSGMGTCDKERVMIFGSALNALEEQSECLRQMKSPAKCLKQ